MNINFLIFFIFVIISVVFLLIHLQPLFIKCKFNDSMEDCFEDSLCEVIEEGYIMCTLGNNYWSDYFKNFSEIDKRFSHVGIIVKNNEDFYVIHSTGTLKSGMDYVKEDSIKKVIEDVRAIGIFKIQGIESCKISEEAKTYLSVPFDWQFDMHDNSKLYCTELLFVILKKLMPEIELKTVYFSENNKEVIPLEAFSNSEIFSEIFFWEK